MSNALLLSWSRCPSKKGGRLVLPQPLMPFRFNRVRRIAFAVTVICFHSVAQPAKSKDADLSALRQDVGQLKAQQQQMLNSIEEIKRLLLKRMAGDAATDAVFTTEVAGETFKGRPTASLVIIEYGDFE